MTNRESYAYFLIAEAAMWLGGSIFGPVLLTHTAASIADATTSIARKARERRRDILSGR